MDTSKELLKMIKGIKLGIYSVSQLSHKANDKDLVKKLKDLKQLFKDQIDLLKIEAQGFDEKFPNEFTTPLAGKTMINMKMVVIHSDLQVKKEVINVLLMGAEQSQEFLDKHPNLDKMIKKEIIQIIQHYYDLIKEFNKKG